MKIGSDSYLMKHVRMMWNDCMESNDDTQYLGTNFRQALDLRHHRSSRLEEKPCKGLT